MTNAQTIKTTLTSAAALLNTEEAALEVQLLLQHVLKVNRAWLIAHENDALDVKDGEANNHAVFEALLKRRLNGEPIAYILGYREFYGLKLKVTPYTLIRGRIPRLWWKRRWREFPHKIPIGRHCEQSEAIWKLKTAMRLLRRQAPRKDKLAC